MDQTFVTRIIEAALLASHQPLSMVQLNGLFPLDEPAPEGSIATALQTLQAQAPERGVELVEVASGWRYQVQADVHPWVARLWTERNTRYTRATLETLALIAYRQPITRGEIEQIRGVSVNSNIIKALEEREWIRVVGHRDVPGKPELLGTTKAFLDYFNLKRLDELPPLSELKDFGELEPQLALDGADAPRAVGGVGAGDDAGPALADEGNDSDMPAETDVDDTADATAQADGAETGAKPAADATTQDHTIDAVDATSNDDAIADNPPESYADNGANPSPALADDGDSPRSNA